MDKAPSRAGLCLGWVTFFFWPLAVGAVLFVAWRAAAGSDVLALFVLLFLIGVVCIPICFAAVKLAEWVGHLFATDNPYGCPVCGHDIRDNPHRCTICGTRLIWGELPHPGAGRYHAIEISTAERCKRLILR